MIRSIRKAKVEYGDFQTPLELAKLVCHSQNLNIACYTTYRIDAKKYFDATVEACLLFCKFDRHSKNYFCNVFNSLDSPESYQIGYRNNVLIRDVPTFDKLSKFYDMNLEVKWRSGIKHDCSKIVEFRKIGNIFVNGIGEAVELEETYLFPLLKGSDVAQGRIKTADRYVLVTQRFVGESTDRIKELAPQTWQYLESHEQYLGLAEKRAKRLQGLYWTIARSIDFCKQNS